MRSKQFSTTLAMIGAIKLLVRQNKPAANAARTRRIVGLYNGQRQTHIKELPNIAAGAVVYSESERKRTPRKNTSPATGNPSTKSKIVVMPTIDSGSDSKAYWNGESEFRPKPAQIATTKPVSDPRATFASLPQAPERQAKSELTGTLLNKVPAITIRKVSAT
jgi:hypothetical protein